MKLGTAQKKMLFDFLPHISGRIAKKYIPSILVIQNLKYEKEYLSIVDVSFMLAMQKMTIK